jgi:hypothetical protein
MNQPKPAPKPQTPTIWQVFQYLRPVPAKPRFTT